ncbi:transketolase [Halobacteriovorax sp. HLS]|uniref:transketolase n=1 Tax=Halobacteriovorax sp. HLS TaxID=2234000 RepID=UPI000FD9205C|nr:transketolase [Halobacteriovorax sp. HLS]
MKTNDLIEKCEYLRKKVLDICLKAETGHVTSSMSCVEILATLYYKNYIRVNPENENDPQRDRFILSKAQASPLLYTILADLGYYDMKELDKFAQKDGIFGVHLQNTVPGVETTAGALGHGLGVGAGIALSAKMNRELYLTYVLLGDGELYEGSIWESMKFASHNRLNNLVGIIDRNYLCTLDFTENILALEPLEDKIKAFGWNCIRVDGHCIESLDKALSNLRSRPSSVPTMIIADTVKGKGVDVMSFRPLCHGVPPKGDDIEVAKKEVGL